jgi:YVTN family beta-propeller protein
MRSLGIRTLWVAATLLAAAAAAGGGCGGPSSGGSTTTGGSSNASTGAGNGTTSSTGGQTTSSTTSSTGTGGSTTGPCTTTAKGQLRGSAIALTSDDKTLVTVNRDAGTVTVMSVDYTDGFPKMTVVKELPVGTTGSEPWQVVIDGCDATAYVALRHDQQVVEITGINTAAPAVGKSVNVGSEPTSLALTPNNTALYVSNWVDGTLSVVDPHALTVTNTIDLNKVIAATGVLGMSVTGRASMAHPRGVAITNNGDNSDSDETVYVTEWFAGRTKPEDPANLAGSDTNWKGLLYKIPVMTGTATTIDLPAVTDTGFKDAKGNTTGCFPNQVASVTIDSGFAYVTSTCASPVGPTGVFQFGACQINGNCAAFGAGSTCDTSKGVCTGSCTTDAQCGHDALGNVRAGSCVVATGECTPDTDNAKTTTHPGLSIVDLTAAKATTVTLDSLFSDLNAGIPTASGMASTRMPLLPTDVDFRPGFGYVASAGADALFRLAITNGAITKVGAMGNPPANGNFIDVRTPVPTGQGIHLPIGLAISKNKAFGFVADDGTRDVTAVDFSTQLVAVSSGMMDFRVTSSTALPMAGTPAASVLQGKRLFTTGLARWSLAGAAWGSCAACHVDGLTDNVTWYFARGPRQTVSLDGTFAHGDPTDQRVLNWTGIFDEVADFEGNVRGISGGIGALVSSVGGNVTAPFTCMTGADCPNGNSCNAVTGKCNANVKDRINQLVETPQQIGLQGSTGEIANPMGTSAHPHTVLPDWMDILHYVQSIRSPRAPTNLVAADVTAGKAIFSDPAQGNCVGCHSGAKWTISKVFYTPGDVPNDAFGSAAATSLSVESWLSKAQTAGFFASLFPSTTAGKQTMRSGAPPGFEQIQCVLRPVGTIGANGAVPNGVSPAAVNVLELRQDMVTGGQGAGATNANDFTAGFNTPSLLGLQVGAPYFHAGNARTLEEALTTTFVGHYQTAVAQVFDLNPATNPQAATIVRQLTAYLLSIDGSTTPFTIPAAGTGGGDICSYM